MGLQPWPVVAMGLAFEIAKNSEDPYRKVGACVLRKNHRVASLGFNGPPPGIELDWSDRDKRREQVIHAEPNALIDLTPEDDLDIMAVTHMPCGRCMTDISAFKKIRKVYYTFPYEQDNSAIRLAELYGIELIHLPLGGVIHPNITVSISTTAP
jgi:dCMP deaminase